MGIGRIDVIQDILCPKVELLPRWQSLNLEACINIQCAILRFLVPGLEVDYFRPASDYWHLFYHSRGLSGNKELWAHLYNSHTNNRDLAALKTRFGNSLIIGYEISPFVTEAFTKLNIPWVNFKRHPGDFIHSGAIDVASSSASVLAALETYKFNEEWAHLEAKIALSAASRKCPSLPRSNARYALILCGNPYEPDCIHEGTFQLLKHSEATLKKISRDYDRIMVVVEQGNAESVLLLTQLLPKFEIVDDDPVRLLSTYEMESVFAVNPFIARRYAYFVHNSFWISTKGIVRANKMPTHRNNIVITNALEDPQLWYKILQAIMGEMDIPLLKISHMS